LVLGRKLESIRRKLDRKSNPTELGDQRAATVAQHKVTNLQAEHGPGAATVMSRLMRDELERQNRGGVLDRALKRWWVVLPLFLLVVGTIVWTFWPLSQDTLYERGSELMKSKEPTDWERAWRDYFQPLNERFPDHPYQEQVEKFRIQIETAR